MNTCKFCGVNFEPAPKVPQQKYCSISCKEKYYYAHRDDKADRRHYAIPVISNREDHPAQNPFTVVAAPDEYLDYVGLEYNSIQMQASLEMGALPPGIILRRGKTRLIVRGEPTPLEFCLRGLGHYKHQKLEKVIK